jgi:hypothetical protein
MAMGRRGLAAALVACACTGSPPGGAAGGPGVTIDVRLPADAPDVVAEDFVLEVRTGATRGEARGRALTKAPIADGPIAVVLLVQGNERFMGNSASLDEMGEPRDPLPGAHGAVRLLVDALAKGLPARAQVAVVTYGSEVVMRAPFAPAASISGEVFGGEELYRGVGSKQLIPGLEGAIDLLTKQPGRRVLVAIGDAGDTNLDADVKDLVSRARAARVEIYVLHASARRDDLRIEGNMKRARALGALGAELEAPELDALPAAAKDLLRAIDSAWRVEFPARGLDLAPDRDHEGAVRIGLARTPAFRFKSADDLAQRIFVLR